MTHKEAEATTLTQELTKGLDFIHGSLEIENKT